MAEAFKQMFRTFTRLQASQMLGDVIGAVTAGLLGGATTSAASPTSCKRGKSEHGMFRSASRCRVKAMVLQCILGSHLLGFRMDH